MREAVGAAVLAGGMFLRDQGLDMGGVLDLGALVVTASMTGEDVLAVDNAHLVGIGEHGERALHVGVGDGIIIQIETDIRRLAGGDRHPLEQRVGVVGQLHQKMRFRGEGLANAEAVLFGAGSIRRQAAVPDIGLSIEVIQISKFAGSKEGGANVSNCTFDPTFFISPGDGDRTRIKSIASSKLEQGGMKADDVTLALQHSAFEIIVENDPWDPGPCFKGLNMAAQEVLHAGIEEEAQKDLARIAQHHDEGHQRPARAADHEMTEVCPVDLGLLAWQSAQTQKGFGLWTWSQACDEVPEVVGAASVTPLVHHYVQPAGGQHWKLFQGLVDEGQVRIDPRWAWPQADWWQTGLGEHPLHRSTIYVELPGDGGRRPFLDVEIAQDLSLAFRGDRHDRVVLGEVGRRFEGPGGGARTLDEQTASSGIGTSGSAMSIALRQGKLKVRLLSPPSPVAPNHPVAVVVNPDASRSFAGRASDGPVPHGPSARGGSSGSVDRRHAGRDIGPPEHSRRHNRSDRGRSSC